ncbi:MAG: hypothetical protein BGO67_02430 [Alphaproteobacteria bacterium 41-28]|nr:MAG: hypothetical protein BGO67_02430 [Alphaproteobacteria bacterium 41-28]
MKPYFSVIIFGLLFESQAAFSQTSSSSTYAVLTQNHKLMELDNPSVKFSVQFMGQLSGMANAREGGGELSCTVILNPDWAYPNALVTPFCFNAQTDCIRYDLMQQQLKLATGPALETARKLASSMREFAILSLYGCKLALEASLRGSQLQLPQAGSYGPPGQGATPPIAR